MTNPLSKTLGLLAILTLFLLAGCETKIVNEWTAAPFIDAYGNENGFILSVDAERLSSNINEATISFNEIEDLISGGYKEIFTITVDSNSPETEFTVTTPDQQEYVFTCYSGLIFNIDYESNDIAQMIALMEYPYLIFKTDEYSFTLSTSKFIALYQEHFSPSM